MPRLKTLLPAAILAATSAPSQAADWWLVSQPGADRAALFADVESLRRHDGRAELRTLRIDRTGRSGERLETIRCTGEQGRSDQAALHRFACAPDGERDRYGLILAGMSPQEAARLVFAQPRPPRS